MKRETWTFVNKEDLKNFFENENAMYFDCRKWYGIGFKNRVTSKWCEAFGKKSKEEVDLYKAKEKAFIEKWTTFPIMFVSSVEYADGSSTSYTCMAMTPDEYKELQIKEIKQKIQKLQKQLHELGVD